MKLFIKQLFYWFNMKRPKAILSENNFIARIVCNYYIRFLAWNKFKKSSKKERRFEIRQVKTFSRTVNWWPILVN